LKKLFRRAAHAVKENQDTLALGKMNDCEDSHKKRAALTTGSGIRFDVARPAGFEDRGFFIMSKWIRARTDSNQS